MFSWWVEVEEAFVTIGVVSNKRCGKYVFIIIKVFLQYAKMINFRKAIENIKIWDATPDNISIIIEKNKQFCFRIS
ncbi:hypothetical protein U5B43_09060 [Campylobacter sp. 9BO]|uniref:hypothetical protein n=1 Tax=Campylobacter sp. 9BO TaxID=3424759 RepID=UPI003D3372BE